MTSAITGYQSTSDVGSSTLRALIEHDDEANLFVQKLRANVYYRNSQTKQYSLESGVTQRSTVRPRYRDISYKDAIVGGGVIAESSADTGRVNHKLTYGFDVSKSMLQMSASGTGWITCTGTQYCEYFPKTRYSLIGAYLQDDMRIGALSIVPGLRYDAYDISPQASAKYDSQAVANGQPAATSKSSAISPRLAFIYEISPALSPYVQYARGFRSPSPHEINSYFNNAAQGYSQIANSKLRPESSDSYEIGLRGKLSLPAGRFSYSAAAFSGRYRDFINSARVSGSGTISDPTIFQYVNAARAAIYGMEARVDWHLSSGFAIKSGFAYTKGTATNNNGAETGLDSVAPLSIVAGVRYEPNQRWFVQSDAVYNAAKKTRDVSVPSNFVTPSFFLMDASVGYRISANTMLYAGIRNLFDRKYWNWTDIRGLSLKDNAVTNDAYTEPGRGFNISMKIEY